MFGRVNQNREAILKLVIVGEEICSISTFRPAALIFATSTARSKDAMRYDCMASGASDFSSQFSTAHFSR
jgi:hypothetical protein